MSALKKQGKFRTRISKRLLSKTDVPIIVYVVVLLAMLGLWELQKEHFDLAQDFFVELFGVAFTLFIIDVLLVRSKAKRWKIVHEDVDYLISRGINRLRDGLAIRAFNFTPDVDHSIPIIEQRKEFLYAIAKLDDESFQNKLHENELFSTSSYQYFNERASDVWDILNMKYSEYLSPVLVSELINLHINLKDLCAQIAQYRKSERFKEDQNFYKQNAKETIVFPLKNTVKLSNTLNELGYSQAARQKE